VTHPNQRFESTTRGVWLRGALAASCVAILLSGACHERIAGVERRSTDQLHFLRTRTGAPPLAALSASFYAKRGADRDVALYYHALAGATDSVRLLALHVPAGALASAPDGRVYAPGDSVLITVTVADPAHMIVSFQPTGLTFSSAEPARLEMSFAEIDPDLNQDGVVDALDAQLEAEVALWVQETPGGLWTRLTTALFLDLQSLDGAISGFSGYAAAY
jgi:hypothetical protein